MAETTTTPPKKKSKVDAPPLSEYELHRNKRIKENQAFLAALGLGDDGQKLPKKPSALRKRKRKVEESEKRRSVRLQGGPAPIERLADDPRSYLDFVESRERRKRARRQEPWEPTDEQRERLGIFCMEGFYDWLGTTTKYHKVYPVSINTNRFTLSDNLLLYVTQFSVAATGKGTKHCGKWTKRHTFVAMRRQTGV